MIDGTISHLQPLRREPVSTPPDTFFTLHHWDARRIDEFLSPYSDAQRPLLTCSITSPPYWTLKDYGHSDQIGWGQSYDEYLIEMRRVFRSLFRHTRPDGSLWVVADSLRAEMADSPWRLEPLPFHLADQATDCGWILREVIIWRKDRTLPWSGRGRLRNTFEYVLLFVKGDGFKFAVDRLRNAVELEEWWVKWPERYNPVGKVPGNVWDIPIPVQGAWRNTDVEHACPLPPSLVERMVLLSTDEGDVVFDPFAGSGIVLAEAQRLGRKGLGVELVKRYIRAYHHLVRPERLSKVGEAFVSEDQTKWLSDTIWKLRQLKLPRVLYQKVRQSEANDLKLPVVAAVLPTEQRITNATPTLELLFGVDDDYAEGVKLEDALLRALRRPPASKFGVKARVVVLPLAQLFERVKDHELFLYPNGRTYMHAGTVAPAELSEVVSTSARDRFCPIVSPIEVHEHPRALRLDATGK